MPINGDLETMPLVELLQWAGGNRRTGVLELERKKIRKQITLRDGRIVGCSSDDPNTRLGQLLISNGKISRKTLASALRKQSKSGQSLPDILVDDGAITREEILEQVREQAEEMICGMFEWEDAVFTFRTEATPGRHSIEVDLSVENTLLDGACRQDDLQRIGEVFPSRGIVIARTEKSLPPQLEKDAAASQLLELFDEEHTLAEVLARAHASEYQTLKLLFTLHDNGNVEIVGERPVDDQDDHRTQLPSLAEATDSPEVDCAIDKLFGGAAEGPPSPAEETTTPARTSKPAEMELLIRVASQRIEHGDHENALAILEACYDANPNHEVVGQQLRRAEESYVEFIQGYLLPQDGVLSAVESPAMSEDRLTPMEATLFGLIDGESTVESLLLTAPLRRFQVMWTLQRMVSAGLVRLDPPTAG